MDSGIPFQCPDTDENIALHQLMQKNWFGGVKDGGFGGTPSNILVMLWNPAFPNACGISLLGADMVDLPSTFVFSSSVADIEAAFNLPGWDATVGGASIEVGSL